MRFWPRGPRGPKRIRREMQKFDYSKLPKTQHVSLEQAIDDGMLLAERTVRMDTKNLMLIDVLRGDENFDRKRAAGDVREALEKVALESDDHATRLDAVREASRRVSGVALDHHDYRAGDSENLEFRAESHRGLARRLREACLDGDYVARIADGAREDAWDEVGREISTTLDLFPDPITEDDDYQAQREIRMQLLKVEDLGDLARTHDRRLARKKKPRAS